MNENQVTIFTNEEFGNVRTIMIEGKPYFCGKDIAEALGYAKPRNAIATHCKGALKRGILTEGGNQEMSFIPEGDIYRLIIRSKLPSAEKFENWVMDEVLPQLRQTGSYSMTKQDSYMIEDPIERAKRWIEEQEEKKMLEKENKKLLQDTKIQQQVIGELQPKADYTDEILKCPGTVTITQIAKDYGMSGTKMNKILNELGVQFKKSGQWFIYEKYNGKGYTKSQTVQIERHGVKDCVMNTKWTQKGRLFLYELLKNEGIYPNIEKGDF